MLFYCIGMFILNLTCGTLRSYHSYDPTIESTHQKTIRFRKVHFATNIVDTAGMVRFF